MYVLYNPCITYELVWIRKYIWVSGAKQEREKNDARDSKRAAYLRSQNVPENVISTMLALK